MELREVYKNVLEALCEVGADISSSRYMYMVLDTVIKSHLVRYPFLSAVEVDPGRARVYVGDVFDPDPRLAGAALSEIVRFIKKPFTSMGKQSFTSMVQAQIDTETRDELRKLNINL
ncbi:MAG: hypothetical protein ACOCWQ_05685 [Nanoarchaeota archaeon]